MSNAAADVVREPFRALAERIEPENETATIADGIGDACAKPESG